MRLYEYFRRNFAYEAHFCKTGRNNLPSPRNRTFWTLYFRQFILFTIVFLVVTFYIVNDTQKKDFAEMTPESALKYLHFQEKQYTPIVMSDLKRLIEEHNTKQSVDYSSDILLEEFSTVIVIFVDKFKLQLKYLLASLSSVQDIGKVLLVFSHSYYDDNANDIIKSIDFCKFIQIYYPYSLQVYPDGVINFERKEPGPATEKNGEPQHKSVEKHHWWWTMNQVFERLLLTRRHERLVVILKDDVFLLKDFLYMLQVMNQAGNSVTKCDFYSLATPKPLFFHNEHNGVEVMSWNPKYHADVLAFNSVTWNQIVSHYDVFCAIGDNDWMTSLLHVSQERDRVFKVMSNVLPRAYKTSYYGWFQDLIVFKSVYNILDIQRRNKENLFPRLLEIYDHVEVFPTKLAKDLKHGSSNDSRDIELCLNMTEWKIKRILFETARAFTDI